MAYSYSDITFLEKDVTFGTCRRKVKDYILIVVDLGVHWDTITIYLSTRGPTGQRGEGDRLTSLHNNKEFSLDLTFPLALGFGKVRRKRDRIEKQAFNIFLDINCTYGNYIKISSKMWIPLLFIYSGFSSGNTNVILIRTMDRNGSLTLTQTVFLSSLVKTWPNCSCWYFWTLLIRERG